MRDLSLSAASNQQQLKIDQLKLAYQFYPLAVSSNFLLMLLNAVAMWFVVDHAQLLLWVLGGAAINGYRLLIHRRFPVDVSAHQFKALFLRHEVATIGAGAIWGYSALFIMPANSLPHVLIYTMTVAGLCAGASSTLAATPRIYIYFLLSCLIPTGLRLYFLDDAYGVWMAASCLIYLCYMWVACMRNEQVYVQNLQQAYSLQQQTVALAESGNRLDLHYERSPLGVIEWDRELRITRWNPAAEGIFGRRQADMLGATPKAVLGDGEWYFEKLLDSGESFTSTLASKNAQGDIISCEWVSTPLQDENNNLLGFISFVTDVTERIARDQMVMRQAYHDAVTGLPNRYYFLDRLAQEVTRVQRFHNYSSVLFIDLDHFKVINDSLGHAIGDELLKQFAVRLKRRLREYEIVARFGGDEFVVLLENLDSNREKAELLVAQIAQSLNALVQQPFTLEGNQYTLSCSIGITLFNSGEYSEDELLKQADLALYNSKHAGRNHYSFFKQEMSQKASRHLVLLNSLREATERDELSLVFQPKAGLQSLELQGAEVLLRWHSAEHGLISPGEFIPILENSTLISKVGAWVLDRAFACLSRWLTQQRWREGMRLAINISPNQLLENNFVQTVSGMLDTYQLPGKWLEFEITENVLVRDTELVSSVLRTLSDLGIRFSIDDFGTGYSSLAYLKALPIDVLKIDKSFIDHCTEEGNDRAIIRSILSICSELNLTSVAEGVETEEQRQQLLSMGCDVLQGYYYGRPVAAAEFEIRLKPRAA